MIGIIVPLFQEAAVFKIKKNAVKMPVQITDNLLLFVSGIGIKNVTIAVDLIAPKVSHLISWGTAGGLTSNLKAGDLLIPDVVSDKNKICYSTDSKFNKILVESLPSGISFSSELISESTTILNDINEKEAFRRQNNAVACDMESASIARLASEKGIPFNALRVVTDDYSTRIPKSVSLSISKDGDFSKTKFLFHTIKHPKEIVQVIHLAINFRKVKKTMKILREVLLNL